MLNVAVIKLRHLAQGIRERKTAAKEKPVSFFQSATLFFGKPGASQSDCVQPAHARRVAIHHKKRQHVLNNLRLATDHRVTPYANELVAAHIIGEKSVILDHDVSCERDFICEDVVVAYLTVVCNVNANHKKITRAYAGFLAFTVCAMHCYALTNQVVVAYDQTAALALKLHVLRLASEYCVLEDAIACADCRESLDDSVRAYLTPVAYLHVFLNDDIRADANAIGNLG